MGRKKIEISYIVDDRKRASTFEKRRIGLFKKASELNQLCGVNISVMIMSGNSLYRFAHAPGTFSEDQVKKRADKWEEDFTNDSLSEFIKKKGQKSATTTGSDSIDHQSACDDRNAVLTDDEDPRFDNELELYNLLDSYKNLDTEIRPPTTDKPELTLLTSRTSNSNSHDKVNESARLAFSFDAIDQFPTDPMKSFYCIPTRNRIQMTNCPGIVEDRDSFSKSDLIYSELVPIPGPNADNAYSAPSALSGLANDSVDNSRWRNHKSLDPQHSELYFNATSEYNISVNGLDTPVFESYNTDQLQHLNNGFPSNFHDPFEGPISKRLKILIDSP